MAHTSGYNFDKLLHRLLMDDYERIYAEIKGEEMPAQVRNDILTAAPHLNQSEPQADGGGD